MFGLPPGNALRESVVELTRDHTRSVGELIGTEPPLLRLLEVAIGADTSGGAGGAGRNKNSAPLDVTALSLWEEIGSVVAHNWPGRLELARRGTHLIDRLTAWTNVVAAGPDEPHLLEYCEYWASAIRELLEPTRRVPLRGVACMGCKLTWVFDEQDGQTTYQPALIASISDRHLHGVEVRCQSCEGAWSGLALQLLAS
jgi:hypothetical protein